MTKVMSAPRQVATALMREESKNLTSQDFNNAVRVEHEDGSIFFIRNACLELWTDSEAKSWLFVFAEHFDDMCLDAEDLESYSVIAPAVDGLEKKSQCCCTRCRCLWAGAYTNDLQMCSECYSAYYLACTCSECGAFKGGFTENSDCKRCVEKKA